MTHVFFLVQSKKEIFDIQKTTDFLKNYQSARPNPPKMKLYLAYLINLNHFWIFIDGKKLKEVFFVFCSGSCCCIAGDNKCM